MTFCISTKIQEPCKNIENLNLFPQESLLLGVLGIKPEQFINRLGLNKLFQS